MTIAADIKPFYPDDWDQIRERVLERATRKLDARTARRIPPDTRAGDLPDRLETAPCCEWCGRPNRWKVTVFEGGLWAFGGVYFGSDGTEHGPAGDVCWGSYGEGTETTTVLTVAHLDQDPRGDDIDRLRALCQRCHLTFDAQPEQRAKRERIYAELRGQQSLFGGSA
jgi:hypothetical protein